MLTPSNYILHTHSTFVYAFALDGGFLVRASLRHGGTPQEGERVTAADYDWQRAERIESQTEPFQDDYTGEVVPVDPVRENYIAALRTLLETTQLDPQPAGDPVKDGPGQSRRGDPGTSRAAAKATLGWRGGQRFRTFVAIARAGESGTIASDLIAAAGIPYRSLTPRIGELKRGGWVKTTGETRVGDMGARQDVIVLTPRGLAAYAELPDDALP